jgi:hypothetical protein
MYESFPVRMRALSARAYANPRKASQPNGQTWSAQRPDLVSPAARPGQPSGQTRSAQQPGQVIDEGLLGVLLDDLPVPWEDPVEVPREDPLK